MEYTFLIILVTGLLFAAFLMVGKVGRRVNSSYSRMLIADERERRVLYFIYDDGRRVLQSAMHRKDHYRLVVPYSRVMFVSHLFVRRPLRCLVVGLGGGSIARFYYRYFPGVQLDVVELDPEVLRVARRYFRLPEGVSVVLKDALAYLRETDREYDVIHVDAYLKSDGDTDTLGVPLPLKSAGFYSLLRSRLAKGGVAVFNLNSSLHMREDVNAMRPHFSRLYLFRVPRRNSLVVVGTSTFKNWDRQSLLTVAHELDREGVGGDLLFEELPHLLLES